METLTDNELLILIEENTSELTGIRSRLTMIEDAVYTSTSGSAILLMQNDLHTLNQSVSSMMYGYYILLVLVVSYILRRFSKGV